MFIFDIETIGIESTSVILSAALTFVDSTKLSQDPSEAYFQLLDSTCLVKFDVKEQLDLGRSTDSNTVAWWKRQIKQTQEVSFLPNKTLDKSAKDATQILRDFWASIPDSKNMQIWTRGGLDQMCFESLQRTIGTLPFVPYNNYRDVRTFIDLVYPDASGGYIEVPGFDEGNCWKHQPQHDCAFDALQMLRGKQ